LLPDEANEIEHLPEGESMKSWRELKIEASELAGLGASLLFRSGGAVGQAFLATLREDGAPRLHPVSLVRFEDRLYVLIPPASPKCADLIRDGRFALQAFPPPDNQAGEEFYLAGIARRIQDPTTRQSLIDGTHIRVDSEEVLFELYLERAMYTRLENWGTPEERPSHRVWRAQE
jgi:Pyridoxamine 5'-phosphate oxidase